MEVNEFDSLKRMLTSSDEDFNIAVENIKNLKIDAIYIVFLVKILTLKKRSDFVTMMTVQYGTFIDDFKIITKQLTSYNTPVIYLAWNSVYEKIKTDYKDDENVKATFKSLFLNEFDNKMININNNWTFFNEKKLEILW
tara:strand:- start:38153 stop:38569 length:417 start_codon:yes stop_codon:yes gene_type:complete